MAKEEKNENSDFKPSGTWASEAFDFLRLFQRVNGQIQGLIIIEIGWTLLLLLAKGLSQTDAIPIVSVPYPHFAIPLIWSVVDFRLTTIYSSGVVLIALIWFFTSGLYLYIYLPFTKIIRYIKVLLVTVVFFIIVFIPFVLGAFASFILARRWERRQDPEKLKKVKEKLGTQYTKKVLDQVDKDNYIWQKVVEPLLGYYGLIISFLISKARIGLAPFYAYSFEEDIKAAKAPMQIFAAAIGTLQTKLRNLDDLNRLSFWSIPNVVKVDSFQRANFIRRWMGLDTLLWGSYLSIEPPLIWLNIDQERRRDKKESSSDEDLSADKYYPFPRIFQTKDYLVVVNQDDLLDIYIVLLVTLIHTLNLRQDERRSGLFISLDKLGYSISAERKITLHLIRDALFLLDKKNDYFVSKDFYPTARKVLVDIAGQWIGHQMEFGGGFGDKISIRALREVAAKCVDLDSSNANHYYRLAAIESMLCNEKAVNDAIRLAQKYDQAPNWVNPIELVSGIEVDLHMFDGVLGETAYKLAKIMSLTAQAVTTGDYAKSSIREAFIKTDYWQFIETEITDKIDKDEIVSLKVLCNLLSINIPQKYYHQMR